MLRLSRAYFTTSIIFSIRLYFTTRKITLHDYLLFHYPFPIGDWTVSNVTPLFRFSLFQSLLLRTKDTQPVTSDLKMGRCEGMKHPNSSKMDDIRLSYNWNNLTFSRA